MKVLLIGGTGVISAAVCKRCLDLGYTVNIMNRGKTRKNIDTRVNLILADIRKESINDLKNKLNGIDFDVVVDFLTFNVEQLKKTLTYINCKQYIFISSATVYSEKNINERYKETDEKNNCLWDYCINKIKCEKYLKQKSIENKNFIYTIVRPYVTYSEKRIPNQMLLNDYYTIIDRILNDLPIVIFGDNVKCSVISSKDFAVGLVGLFNNDKAFNEDFHITSDVITSWEDIIKLVGKKLNKKVKFVKIPVDFIKNYKNTSLDLIQVIGDKSRNMCFDNSKIKKVVPVFNSDSKFEDNVDEIISYYINNSKNDTINYLWNGCVDRLICDYNKTDIKKSEYKMKRIKDIIYYNIGRKSYLYCICKTLKNIMKKL